MNFLRTHKTKRWAVGLLALATVQLAAAPVASAFARQNGEQATRFVALAHQMLDAESAAVVVDEIRLQTPSSYEEFADTVFRVLKDLGKDRSTVSIHQILSGGQLAVLPGPERWVSRTGAASLQSTTSVRCWLGALRQRNDTPLGRATIDVVSPELPQSYNGARLHFAIWSQGP